MFPVFVCAIMASSRSICFLYPIRMQRLTFILRLFVLQNTTDSSSNSSHKLESSLPPLESSPLPQRHHCLLAHRYDLHDPYRLSDHYFLDPVRETASLSC